ncbi:hypothetical protein GCM10010348_77850 [Streptomyces anthocyanicus]|uniref:hypothetical protein n=1 Tax=Streptomyces TaxID=1883 RepID=UPI0012916213|nr:MULTISPECIES: hypothetical protein [Streptomyces]MBQ0953075.1 hypothetical protein [Streptomyces sp. RK76]QFX86836.1 hypothetical protein GEV49_39060 [Streptomyces sp. SYP-A7193]GHC38923.1 hypothetical protein GCM10010348_77850 [Streptomyces anthocyanicus]
MAAVSLAISAWGTNTAARVANDQLEQSRDQQTSEEKAQASRVGLWAVSGNVVVANRSLDPVHAFVETDGRTAEGKTWYVDVGIVPPCVEFIIKAEAVTEIDEGVMADGVVLKVLGLVFTDAKGSWWERTPVGALDRSDARPDLPAQLSLRGSLVLDKRLEPKELEFCGP